MYHLCKFPFRFNRTANHLLHDAVHRQYQGILFFFSSQKTQFHSSGVSVILFKPEGKLCPNPVSTFMKPTNTQQHCVCGYLAQNFTKIKQHM